MVVTDTYLADIAMVARNPYFGIILLKNFVLFDVCNVMKADYKDVKSVKINRTDARLSLSL